MAVPSAKMKINKDGVKFESSVEKVNYTIRELTRAALKDTAKFLLRLARKRFYSKFKRRDGRVSRGLGYWVRKRENDLLIGINVAGKQPAPPFWFMYQEFGTEKTPKYAILQTTVNENLEIIRKIQAQYLSALNNEEEALALIDEEEELVELEE